MAGAAAQMSVAAAQEAPGGGGEAEGAPEDEIVVRGRAQKLYRVEATDTGKLPVDPLSAPFVITSINEQLIEDQGARDAQDIYRNISGVSLFSYAGVTARGFRQEEIFFDGLRGDPYVGFNVPQLFNIERVDFLKGPAGMLYGPGSPGGLFNYVTKKPTETVEGEARGIFGTEGRIGGSFELSGALPTEGTSGRVGYFYEERSLPRINADSATEIFDVGLAQELGFATLTLQATRYEQDQGGNRLRGVPVDDEGEFVADRRWNHNEASDYLDLVSNNLQALLDGEIGTQFSWNAALRYTQAEQDQEYHEPIQLFDIDDPFESAPNPADSEFVLRQFRDQFREERQLTAGVNGIWTRDFGPLENRLLVGYEHFDGELDFLSGGANTTSDMVLRFLSDASLPSDIIPLSLTNPAYGVTRPELYDVQFSPLRETDTTRSGGYLLEEATIGPVTLVGGVRFDRFEDQSGATAFDDSETTFRFGAIYKIREDVSLFAQWAESYEPQGVGDQDRSAGGPFDPTTGRIVEGGVKTALFGGRVQTSAAVYQIVRENLLQLRIDANGQSVDADGDGVEDLAPLGEVTSEGFEFDLAADITDDWVVTLAYGYNDTRITGDNGTQAGIGNNVGDRFANAPEHQFGFWTRYQAPAVDTAVAFGGDYVGERLSLSGQPVNGYVVFDASIIYSPGPFEVLFRVDNLFDETYAESGFIERTGHFPGAPRSLFVELIKEW